MRDGSKNNLSTEKSIKFRKCEDSQLYMSQMKPFLLKDQNCPFKKSQLYHSRSFSWITSLPYLAAAGVTDLYLGRQKAVSLLSDLQVFTMSLSSSAEFYWRTFVIWKQNRTHSPQVPPWWPQCDSRRNVLSPVFIIHLTPLARGQCSKWWGRWGTVPDSAQ